MDAGARGRRLLQRREYKAKVSEFVPKELEDHVVYENDSPGSLLSPGMANRVTSGINKVQSGFNKLRDKSKVFKAITNVFKSNNPGSNYTKDGKVTAEANSAQMKAMQDAKIKKMEDDKVAEKKKKVDEACWKGYEKKGMKTMFGKRYPNCVKKTKKEEVELEAKKSCGEGEYYCYDEQKCKPIPDGMKVGKDGMLVKEDMKGMSQKSGDKRSTESGAGMTAKGVAKYNRRTGGNLKTAVTTPPSKLKAGSKAAGRRKSFCARSKSWTGPRGKAARRRWNCSYEPELPMIIDERKKLYNTAPLSDRVSNWTKKISEGSLVRGDYGPYISGQSTKKEKKVKIDPKKLPVAERKMTSAEKDKKEKYVKGMKKDKGGFTKRYGKDGKSVMYATATKMAMKKEETLVEKPGDGYLGPTVGKVGIPNPIRLAKDAVDQMNRANQRKVNTVNKISPGSATMPNFKQFNKDTSAAYKNLMQSHEPQGEMIEAKVDKVRNPGTTNKSTDAKINDRNQRAFGNRRGQKGGMHRGDDMEARRYNTKKGRGVKMKGKKDKTPVNYHKRDSQVRVDDLLKSMKENFYRKKYDVKDGGYKKTNKMDKSNKRAGDSKKQYRVLHKDLAKIKEGSLHKWFSGSKSKDGKGGWVNVKTGGTCASDEPGEGTPKCVSSSKRASMTKAERDSASRRKKAADPNQQSKSGAAKPTYVATDKKKKK